VGADKTDLALSGVSEKFESKWLTVSEFQVFHCFNCFKCARYFGQIASKTLAIIFGVAELMLMFVGVVDAVAGGHLGSWMILFLFVFLFAR